MKQQTHLQSVVEVATNYVLGFTFAWLMNRFILPYYGYKVSNRAATELTLIFTVVSILRSYLCRRLFNWIHSKQYDKTNQEAAQA